MIKKIDEKTRQKLEIQGAIASLDYERIVEELLLMEKEREDGNGTTPRVSVIIPLGRILHAYIFPERKSHDTECHEEIKEEIIRRCDFKRLLLKCKNFFPNVGISTFLYYLGFVDFYMSFTRGWDVIRNNFQYLGNICDGNKLNNIYGFRGKRNRNNK